MVPFIRVVALFAVQCVECGEKCPAIVCKSPRRRTWRLSCSRKNSAMCCLTQHYCARCAAEEGREGGGEGARKPRQAGQTGRR